MNTGPTAATAHLKFFDDTGTPLTLPLAFPQSAGRQRHSSATVDQALAAGATLIVQSAAPLANPTPTIGSAQLTTNGDIGGFVIFRYNPNGQEAVVPLESRNAHSLRAGLRQHQSDRDRCGDQQCVRATSEYSGDGSRRYGRVIATDTIPLAANGHLAFTLATDKYPVTANSRGTLEFGTPAGDQIGVLGIRIPVGHTFTTLPALAK